MSGNMEDGLDDLLKFASFSGGANLNNMLNSMMRNTQLNALKQVRRMLDEQIKILNEQAKSPSQDDAMNPFIILGVEMNATKEEVDKAYKEKAHEMHPDKGGNDRDMMMLNAAYQAIRQLMGWK